MCFETGVGLGPSTGGTLGSTGYGPRHPVKATWKKDKSGTGARVSPREGARDLNIHLNVIDTYNCVPLLCISGVLQGLRT